MPSRRAPRALLTLGLVVATGFDATAVAESAAAQTVPPNPTDRFDPAPTAGPVDPAALPPGLAPDARVTVMVELTGDPVAVVQAEQAGRVSADQQQDIRDRLRAAQDVVAEQIRARGGRVDSHMQSAYNGMRVNVATSEVAALATLPGVIGVHAVPTYTIDNTLGVPYIGAPAVWQDTGYTGAGIKVAIIDTGVDYTHANFAGPGTVEAFQAADASDTDAPDPALIGPDAPRIKGGFDFVGDDYDADDPTSVPVPDPDPLDCNGHGSHVAGSTGGSGVNADGTTYTGPYDATTHANEFLIGPGVAPQVDLYALRVFGCDGSTNVTTEAIDWAVANDMDVINMSLGSPYGTAGDPSAVAASNAIAAGVVVVASAGNSGPSPYLTGSPGTGNGVVGVAAVDAQPAFPGATLGAGSTNLTAINANGAELPPGPYDVVVLGGAGLGCEVAEYTEAGITDDPADPLTIAVTTRGTCGRVTRAVCGQIAGADAVVMINNAASLPPYEGPITGNSDPSTSTCPTDYEVTIPFLGVSATDGAALRALAGQQLTITAADIANPGYGQFASFSSNGPRNGDSAANPNIAAPGVSVFSTGVGTGTGGVFISGTSMASPMVAGTAALAVQAHPGWAADTIAAALVNTADPGGVAGYSLPRGGAGLADAVGAVNTQVVALGDSADTADGPIATPALSFGFAESATTFTGTKTVTLVNQGSTDATYSVSVAATAGSAPAAVTAAPSTITVPAGGSAEVTVDLSAAAADVAASNTGGFAFREISGSIVFDGDTDLAVPYLMVPRSSSDVSASGLRWPLRRDATLALRNRGGAIAGDADFYTWGLLDADDVDDTADGNHGYDVRAVGVQSFPANADGSEQLLVFAVNNWSRWSNAAANDYEVAIDVDADRNPDYVVFATDSGLVRSGSVDGRSEVFVLETATGALSAAGFLAAAPTDSSTILIPVLSSTVGLTAGSGFTYSVTSFSILNDGFDTVRGNASYNPWDKAFPDADGLFLTLAPGETTQVTVHPDSRRRGRNTSLGLMVVTIDDPAGAAEAALVLSPR